MPTSVYKDGRGKRLKSVTAITKYFGDKGGLVGAANNLGLAGKRHFIEWSKLAKLGTLVHEVCQHNLGGMSIDDAVGEVAGNVPDASLDWFSNCVAAWMQCQREVRFGKVLAIEQHYVSEKWKFGGTPDVAICIGEPAILDFKTGSVFPEVVMQLAAYRELYNENLPRGGNRAKGGYVVQLNRETGNYKLHCYTEDTLTVGWQWFRAVQVAVERYEIVKAGVS